MKTIGIIVAFAALALSACANGVQLPNLQATDAGGIDDVVMSLGAFTVADLQQAEKEAVSAKDNIAALCYPALATFIQSLPSYNRETATVVGAFTKFQRARNVRNVISAGAPEYLLIGCGPLEAQIRNDVVHFVSRVLP